MVVVSAAVVAYRGANRLGDLAQVADERVQRQRLQRRLSFQRVVEVGDVGLVVLPVVDPHRLLVDVRLQRRVVEGKRRKGECHGIPPCA